MIDVGFVNDRLMRLENTLNNAVTEMHKNMSKLEKQLPNILEQQAHDTVRITYVNQLVIDLDKKREDLDTRIGNLSETTCEAINTLLIRVNALERIDKIEYMNAGTIRRYMSYREALTKLYEGHRLARKCWEGLNESIQLADDDSFSLDIHDLQANDWYIVT